MASTVGKRRKDEPLGPSAQERNVPGRKDGSSGPSAPKSTAPSREPALSAPSALPRRKARPRIGSFDYRGPYAYHIILLTQGRSPHLADRSLARRCTEHLKRTAERLGFRLLAFSLMPDHLHALVLGRHEAADLVRFVQRFKQVTAFDFKRETGLRLWQQSFYDRALRVEEDLAEVAAYILANPVRAGLAFRPEDYALSGGEYAEADGAEAPSLRLPQPSSAAPWAGGRRG
jgi:putative transposase